jgi:ketosteroid isomerase-like protein
MKLIMSLIALAALSFVTSVFAQEEESTPSPTPADEEKASATVEEKPKATPAEEPAAQKKEVSAATKPMSAAKKETTAGAAPQKSASPAAAPASGKKMSTAGALKEMENKWEEAISKHDAAAVEGMVADDFVGVTSKNKVVSRRGMLAEMKADKDTFTMAKLEKLDVHAYGKDVAVVVGISREKGTGKDGKAFDRSYRFTDTWMSRNGKWQCIASQVSLLPSK